MRCVRQEHASQKTWRSAHTCPMYCDNIPPIFLTAPPSYEPITCHLRRCEKRLRDGKLATSSIVAQNRVASVTCVALPSHESRVRPSHWTTQVVFAIDSISISSVD